LNSVLEQIGEWLKGGNQDGAGKEMRKLLLCKGQALCECCLLQGAESVDECQTDGESRWSQCVIRRNGFSIMSISAGRRRKIRPINR
jgi:hypothetical protein